MLKTLQGDFCELEDFGEDSLDECVADESVGQDSAGDKYICEKYYYGLKVGG